MDKWFFVSYIIWKPNKVITQPMQCKVFLFFLMVDFSDKVMKLISLIDFIDWLEYYAYAANLPRRIMLSLS